MVMNMQKNTFYNSPKMAKHKISPERNKRNHFSFYFISWAVK